MGNWVNASCFTSVETAGSQKCLGGKWYFYRAYCRVYIVEKVGCRKIPWWNVNRWLWEAGWKLPVQSLCKVWAPKKCLGGKWYLYVSLWKMRALRKFLDKLQQISLGSLIKAFCSISVDTAGSWKCLDVNKNCVYMHKWVPLWIIQHHFAMTVLSTHVQAS